MRVFDLARPLYTDCPAFPGDPRVRVKTVRTIRQDGFLLEALSLASHSGTHVDAPAHFLEAARGAISDFPASSFVGPRIVADLTAKGEIVSAGRGRFSGVMCLRAGPSPDVRCVSPTEEALGRGDRRSG